MFFISSCFPHSALFVGNNYKVKTWVSVLGILVLKGKNARFHFAPACLTRTDRSLLNEQKALLDAQNYTLWKYHTRFFIQLCMSCHFFLQKITLLMWSMGLSKFLFIETSIFRVYWYDILLISCIYSTNFSIQRYRKRHGLEIYENYIIFPVHEFIWERIN